MPLYEVSITETYSKTFTMQADNEEELKTFLREDIGMRVPVETERIDYVVDSITKVGEDDVSPEEIKQLQDSYDEIKQDDSWNTNH